MTPVLCYHTFVHSISIAPGLQLTLQSANESMNNQCAAEEVTYLGAGHSLKLIPTDKM